MNPVTHSSNNLKPTIKPGRSAFFRYGLAVLSVVLAVLITLFLFPTERNTFFVLLSAVIITSLYGGLGPGLFAALLGTLGGAYLLLPPALSLHVSLLEDGWRLLIFSVIAVIISYLVTLRRRAEEKLYDATQTMNLVSEVTHLVTWEWDVAKDHITTSESFASVYGLPRLATSAQGFALVFPEDKDEHLEKVQKVAKEGGNYQSQFRIKKADTGEIVWLEERGTALVNEAGSVQRIVGVTLDISERKTIEERLKLANYRFQVAEDAAKGFLYDYDPTTGAESRSDGFSKVLGYTHAEVPGGGAMWETIIHPDDVERVRTETQLAVVSGAPGASYEYRLRHKNGGWLWVLDKNTIVRDGEGNPQHIIGSIVDISERKRGEETLRSREELLGSTFAGIEAAITISEVLGGNEFRFISVNPTCTRWSGIPLEAWLNKRPEDILPPQEAKAVCERYARAVQEERSVQYEELLSLPKGEMWAFTTVTPLRDADGKVTRLVATSIDMSERKVAEERLEHLADVRHVILNDVVRALGSNGGGLRLVTERGLVLEEHARGSHASEETVRHFAHIPLEAEHPAAQAARGEALFFRNVEDIRTRYPNLAGAINEVVIQGNAHLPLKRGEETFGVLSLSFPEERLWDEAERQFALALTDRTAIAYERARLFEETRDSEQKLRLVTDAMPALVSYIDSACRYKFVNKAYTEWFGYASKDILGKTMSEVLGKAAFERLRPHVETALAGNIETFETEVPYKLGGTRFIHAIYTPDMNGNTVKGFFVHVLDISERKRRELNTRFLVDLDMQLSTLAEAEAIETWVIKTLGEYLALERCYFGHIRDEGVAVRLEFRSKTIEKSVMGEYLLNDFFSTEAVEEFRRGVPTVVHDVTVDNRTKAGADHHTALQIRAFITTPVLYQGEWVGALNVASSVSRPWREDEVNLLREVAARVYPLLERAKAVRALQESQAFLERITSIAPTILYLYDLTETRNVWVNRDVSEALGYTPPEVQTLGAALLPTLLHPDDVARYTTHYQRLRLLREGEIAEFEYRMQHKDSSWRWLLSREMAFTYLRDGTVSQIVGAATDVSERKASENALREANEQLRILTEQQKRFVADAAHELRAPLTAIQGNLQLMTHYKNVDPEMQQEMLSDVRLESERLARLVNDLLAIARGDSGLTLEKTPLSLNEVVLEAWRSATLLTSHHELHLGHLDKVEILGNRDRLKQLVLILLENAVKYTPPGGRITLGLEQGLNAVRLCVQDTGIGIDQHDLPHVFERFYRADKARTRAADPTGTGLGLSIAEWIVAQHDGKLWLESEPSKGTTAWVQLPLAS